MAGGTRHDSRCDAEGYCKCPKYNYCGQCLRTRLMHGYVQVCAPELVSPRVRAGFGTDRVYLYSFQVLRFACLDFLNLIKHTEC